MSEEIGFVAEGGLVERVCGASSVRGHPGPYAPNEVSPVEVNLHDTAMTGEFIWRVHVRPPDVRVGSPDRTTRVLA